MGQRNLLGKGVLAHSESSGFGSSLAQCGEFVP